MTPDTAIMHVRFGYGLGPGGDDTGDPAVWLERLSEPDRMAERFPVPGFDTLWPVAERMRELGKTVRDKGANAEAARKENRQLRRAEYRRSNEMLAAHLARAVEAKDPFRERLTWFWADHFTVLGRSGPTRWAQAMYVEDAIRPHLTGRFVDLLKAAVLHPMMLVYLDQASSVGPGSKMAKRREGRGLNENLARELLELHTLGVGGAYGQDDVRQLAELLSGLVVDIPGGTDFRPQRGEPGPETVLGVSYGGREPRIEDIHAVLEDLAAHPDTARHIARKLAVHFVSDTPDAGLVDHLAARFAETDGALLPVYAALLEHPAARDPVPQKARQPYDFIAASLRALGVPGSALVGLEDRQVRRWIRGPMLQMGQAWGEPTGPDGWPEDFGHWITPQGMAARIDWALSLRRVDGLELPDPRDFVRAALGPLASQRVIFAAEAAETRADGVGVVLASPDFQRR